MTILVVLLVIIPTIVLSDDPPTALTQQGTYIGLRKTVNGTEMNCWYGIPYAQQPIGNLRWKPPQPLPVSNGTRYAFLGNACPQKNDVGVRFSEACLTLNVYAPSNATNLPVYIWIHGGSFTTGAGVEYDAAPFVSVTVQNHLPVLVVTINYRLGLLGFLADQALYDEHSGMDNRSTTGNYGILDQMMALDWIQANIQGFGGNSNRITIGGESAGGISVTILLISSLLTKGKFQGAIIQSGALWPNAASQLDKAINNTGKILREMTRCTTTQCLRDLSVDDILKIQNFIASQSIFGASATPVIDGYVLNNTMEQSYVKADFQRVPVLIGSNTNETSLFTCPIFNQSASIDQIQTFLQTLFNGTLVDEILSFYGPISSYANPLAYLNTVYSDSWAHCGSRRLATAFSNENVPVYLYTYNHRIPVESPCLGVAHAAELPMLFPTLLPFLYPFYKFNALEQALSRTMSSYWANFIYTSDPNINSNMTNWKNYDRLSDNELLLDIHSQMRNHYYDRLCSQLWDQYAL